MHTNFPANDNGVTPPVGAGAAGREGTLIAALLNTREALNCLLRHCPAAPSDVRSYAHGAVRNADSAISRMGGSDVK